MKTSDLLHFAFRARDPLRLAKWYADLFEGQFFIHPVMSALGIVLVKLNHPEEVFNGLIEFWPWDIAVGWQGGRFPQNCAAALADQLWACGGEGRRRFGDDCKRTNRPRDRVSHRAASDGLFDPGDRRSRRQHDRAISKSRTHRTSGESVVSTGAYRRRARTDSRWDSRP